RGRAAGPVVSRPPARLRSPPARRRPPASRRGSPSRRAVSPAFSVSSISPFVPWNGEIDSTRRGRDFRGGSRKERRGGDERFLNGYSAGRVALKTAPPATGLSARMLPP